MESRYINPLYISISENCKSITILETNCTNRTESILLVTAQAIGTGTVATTVQLVALKTRILRYRRKGVAPGTGKDIV
jgi:hypothetical protein